MRDHENLKDWLAAALKEIKQLEGKGVWIECFKSEDGNEQRSAYNHIISQVEFIIFLPRYLFIAISTCNSRKLKVVEFFKSM